jgi:hypothetical protein
MKRRLALAFAVSAALLGSSALGGCSNDDPSATDDYFAGLDPAVVSEVLANPVAQDRIKGDTPQDREMRLQGMAMSFMVCRDLYRVYETWVTTGQAPQPAPLPTPEDPRADWQFEFGSQLRAVESGDPDQLRQVLTGPGTCGEWIPTTPGQASGPTIEDSVRALS